MGRNIKPNLSLQEQEDEVILKWLNCEPMTLEETALALWMQDGRKTKHPMTKTGIMKMEQRILSKLRKECERKGISIDDLGLFTKSGRSPASSLSNCE